MKITNDNFEEIASKIRASLAESKNSREDIICKQAFIRGSEVGEYPYCRLCEEDFTDDAEANKHMLEEHINEDEESAINHALLWIKNNQWRE